MSELRRRIYCLVSEGWGSVVGRTDSFALGVGERSELLREITFLKYI